MVEREDEGSDGATDEALRELLRAEHHRAAVEARRRRGELHRQAVESAALVDVVHELAATGLLAGVRTRSGSVPPSTVVEAGRDHVALRGHGPEIRLVPLAAIAAIHPMGTAPSPVVAPWSHDGGPPDLHERLTELALRRTRVRVAFAGDHATGQLRRVGLDLLVITQDDGTDVVVALAALDEVAL